MDPAERKQAILNAAKLVFADKGYHDAGVADIIKEAGIARGTFYLYFKSKSEIFSALIEHIIQSIVEQLTPPTFENEDTILATLRENLERIKRFFLQDPSAARIIMQETLALDAESSERLSDMRHRLIMWMSDLLQEAQDRGILRPHNSDVLAFGFFGAVKEILENTFISGHLKADSNEVTLEMLELFMFGLITKDYMNNAKRDLEQVKKA